MYFKYIIDLEHKCQKYIVEKKAAMHLKNKKQFKKLLLLKFEKFSYWIKKLLVLWADPSLLWKINVYFVRPNHIVAVGDYENETWNWKQTFPYRTILWHWCQVEVAIRL